MQDALRFFDSPLHGALTYRAWPSAGRTTRGNLVFLHGWGDHGGRYAPLAERLAARSIDCWAPDFRGHGRSSGPRGRVHDFGVLIADLRAFLAQVVPAERPIILCGHSMGGCLAAHYALRFPEQLAGLVFNSGALGVNPQVSRLRRGLSHALGALLPTLPLGALKQPEHMASSEQAQAEYARDTLVHHGSIDAGTGRCLLQSLAWLSGPHARLSVPFLALVGEADALVATDAPARLAEMAAAPGHVRRFAGARHDLLLELGAEALANEISTFLEPLLAAAA